MPMTKKELIEALAAYPDDTPLLVRGHSDGTDYYSLGEVTPIEVKKYEKYQWSGSYHKPFLFANCGDEHLPLINAVVLE